VVNGSNADVKLEESSVVSTLGVKVEKPYIVMDGTTMLGHGVVQRLVVKIPASAPVTQPYFTRRNIEQAYYNITDPQLRNAPRTPPALTAWITVTYNGVPVRLGEVLQTASDASQSQPVTVVPAVSLAVSPAEGILLPGAKNVRLAVDVRGNAASAGTVKLTLPVGWSAVPASAAFRGAQTVNFDVTLGGVTDAPVTVTAVATVGGKQYTEGYRMGGYDPRTSVAVYTPATYRTRGVDVRVAPGLRVGYVEGTGDDVPQYLKEMGVPVTMLNVSELSSTTLADFDVVVLGVRAFTAHGDLVQGAPALMDFVKNGGTVIVQYDTATIPDGLAPYPVTLGGAAEKVVEENSKMVLTATPSAVMRWPNPITEKDFDGWVEERGHGFMRTWDAHYEAPTETHDAGQEPQRGGLLVTDYGKGHYVYCAFALYRQMPEGVPGAYRLFANMLSLGKTPTPVGPMPGGTR